MGERKKVREDQYRGLLPLLRPSPTCAVKNCLNVIACDRSQPLSPLLLLLQELSRLLKCFSLDFTLNLKLYSKEGGVGGRKDVNLSLEAKALAACLARSLSLSIYVLCTLSCC